jgi:hypothetical protein
MSHTHHNSGSRWYERFACIFIIREYYRKSQFFVGHRKLFFKSGSQTMVNEGIPEDIFPGG